MNLNKIIAYNKYGATKHGWTPQDFGASDFDKELIAKIIHFQKKHGLTADGMCGSGTFRYLKTIQMENLETPTNNADGEFIICNGKHIPIKAKVIVWNEKNGLKASAFRVSSHDRNPKCFITHWDATLSSHHCAKILAKRMLSVHFLIDNDGTIYQMADTNDVCYHARNANTRSIGVEISNAYYPKWQNWYEKKGFGKRPVIENAICHGVKLKPFLGFYPAQKKALTALYEAINRAHGIPLVAPNTKTTMDKAVSDGSFSGFCSHYHLTKKKIDCAGLDINAICKEAITLSLDNDL